MTGVEFRLRNQKSKSSAVAAPMTPSAMLPFMPCRGNLPVAVVLSAEAKSSDEVTETHNIVILEPVAKALVPCR
jgi:hypothetical protein